jgi:DNA-binding response OmpR family regulator
MPRVMIVEDDLTILSNLSQLLQLSGLDVMEAHDGQEALRLLLECRVHDTALPRMIVSDLMMPNMDGFDLLRAVRGDSHFKKLPFVLLSARSDASDLQQAFALGANDYLIKPFEVDQLMEVIRYHLSNAVDRKKGTLAGKDCTVDTDFFLE